MNVNKKCIQGILFKKMFEIWNFRPKQIWNFRRICITSYC